MGNKFPFSFWGVEASSLYSYTALKSLQETQNNCWEAWTNTQSFWNPWITWLSYCGNLLGFFPPSQYHRIHYCHYVQAQSFVLPIVQHFVQLILLDLSTTDCTFSTLSRHKLAGIQYPLPMLLHSTRQAEKQVIQRAKGLQQRLHSWDA